MKMPILKYPAIIVGKTGRVHRITQGFNTKISVKELLIKEFMSSYVLTSYIRSPMELLLYVDFLRAMNLKTEKPDNLDWHFQS